MLFIFIAGLVLASVSKYYNRQTTPKAVQKKEKKSELSQNFVVFASHIPTISQAEHFSLASELTSYKPP